MSALILDGRTTRTVLMLDLKKRIASLSVSPMLVIIQVGDRADSTAFIRGKKVFAKEIGVQEKHIQMSDTSTEEEILEKVRELNTDSSVQGIILQLPLPPHMNGDKVIAAIDPAKDVDGLTPDNIHDILENEISVMPATARGIRELLLHYDIDLKNKIVTIIGRSKIVGQPIAAMFRAEGATVIVCDRSTTDLISETQKADILVVAAGRPKLITAAHVKPGQVVIDVGITRSADSGLVGDVDFDAVKDIVAAISPVPGGVGPMTVLALFENLVDLCQ